MSVGGGPQGVRRVPKSDVDMSHNSSSPGSCPVFALHCAPAFLLYLVMQPSTRPGKKQKTAMDHFTVYEDEPQSAFKSELHYRYLARACDMVSFRNNNGVLTAVFTYCSSVGRVIHEVYRYEPVLAVREEDRYGDAGHPVPLYYAWVRRQTAYSAHFYGGFRNDRQNE